MNAQNIIVILAGGKGTRYQSDIPKQYEKLNGKELLYYSIEEMKKSQMAQKIIVVLNDENEVVRVQKEYNVDAILGGSERQYSFQNAMDYIETAYADCKKVVFHEAARPLVSYLVIDKYFDLLDQYAYVETCKKITDSLGSYILKAPRREDYYLIQAPEAYRFSVLKEYFDCNSDIYFAANQFPDFIQGYLNFDIKNNIKLTTKDEKILIEQVLKNDQDF